MALELQVSTTQAQKALEQISNSIDLLMSRFERIGASTSGFDAFTQKVAAFRGVPSEALASLTALGNATAKLGNVTALTGIATALNGLSKVNVSQVSAGVERLNTALARIVVPAGLTKIIQELNLLMRAANMAGPSVQKLAQSLNSIQVPAGLQGISTQLQKVTQQATQASSAMQQFGKASDFAGQMAQAFGITLGAIGLAMFIKDSVEAVNIHERFNALIATVDTTVGAANKHWEFMGKVAMETATSVETLAGRYAKFMAAVGQGGMEIDVAQQTFKDFAATLRVFGANAQQTDRAFLALEQMANKGVISMEELRRQLGEIIPAFPALAQAMGTTTAELSQMIQRGEVSATNLPKLAAFMMEKYGKQLPAALLTPQAAFTRLNNAVFFFQEKFGQAFSGQIIPAVNAFAAALGDPSFQKFGEMLGSVIGAGLRLFIDGVAVLIDGLGMLTSIVNQGVEALKPLGTALMEIANFTGLSSLLGDMSEFGRYVYLAVAAITALAIGIGVLAVPLGLVAVGFRIATGAAVGFNIALAPSLPLILGVTLAAAALAIAWAEWPQLISAVTNLFKAFCVWVEKTGDQIVALINSGLESAISGWNSLVQACTGYVENLVNWFNNLMDVGRSVGSAIASAFRSVVSAIQSAINAVSNFISRLMQAIGLSNQVGGGGGGGGGGSTTMDGSMFEEWRVGGKVSSGSPHRQMLPASAFIGAPHFAEGGVSGGGIPAILHDDEAVVPLSGGRSIPVTMAGGGGQVQFLQKIWTSVREGNQLSAVVGQRVLSVGVVFKTEMDRHHDLLTAILNAINAGVTKICEDLYKITQATAVTASAVASSAGGGAPYSFFGSQNLQGNFGSGITTSVVSNDANGPVNTTSNYGRNFGLGRLTSGGLGNDSASAQSGVIKDVDGSYYAISSKAGQQAAENWMVEFGYKKKSYATGTPNTSGEGMAVTVHPNEAIIPLSGGRTVPVELRGNEGILQQINETIAASLGGRTPETRQRQGGDGGRATINVNMYITTPDANSFNKSKDQLMVDLQTRLTRAQKKLGRASTGADDPTRVA